MTGYLISERNLLEAVSEECSCGGSGPDDPKACPACKMYHWIKKWSNKIEVNEIIKSEAIMSKEIKQVTEKDVEQWWDVEAGCFSRETLKFWMRSNGWISDHPRTVKMMTEAEILEWADKESYLAGNVQPVFVKFARHCGIIEEPEKVECKHGYIVAGLPGPSTFERYKTSFCPDCGADLRPDSRGRE